jgi:hypothetical protein
MYLMDPITAAIVAALTVGVTVGAGKLGENLLVDAYTALKDALKKKLGIESKTAKAVDELEQDPSSAGQKLVLQEQIKKAGVDQDADLVRLANVVLERVKSQPGGAQIVQQVTGDQNVVAANSQVSVTYGSGLKKD